MGDKGDANPTTTDGDRDADPRRIEITGDTADLLAARAAALGISVAELIAAMAGSAGAVPRQAAAEGAGPAAGAEPSEARWREVKAWIDSWGKPGERPRPKLGK